MLLLLWLFQTQDALKSGDAVLRDFAVYFPHHNPNIARRATDASFSIGLKALPFFTGR